MINVIQRLKEPFPDRASGKQNLRNFIGVGIFVWLFLFVLQPFGTWGSWSMQLLICASFGALTILFGWLFDLLTTKVFRIKTYGPKWTLGKWILLSMGLITWIAFGNVLLVAVLFGHSWMDMTFPLKMLFNTLLVGIFPLTFSGLMVQLRAARKFADEARQLTPTIPTVQTASIQPVAIPAQTNQSLTIAPSDVRYAEAMQNYVTVYYMQGDELSKELIRSTISSIEKAFEGSDIIRCHRSFLVNRSAITDISGNAQGLKLQVQDIPDTTIPVSRTYIPRLKAQTEVN